VQSENSPCDAKVPRDVPLDSRQILVVAVPVSGVSTTVHALTRRRHAWSVALGPFDAVVGRNGIAPTGAKREGDGTTPSGLFSLEGAFGYPSQIVTKMPYRRIRDDDVWVDDPGSAEYNTWRKIAETGGVSVEHMRRTDGLYEYGLIVGYNRNPTLKGPGSAIFLHVWKGPGIPTDGCIGVAREHMIATLAWLDPAENPLIAIGM
jgi:L,D-peptidoglycan transpeptidase YkuD (ErfK/YbiS/YcfS/YnhG family)